MPDMDEAVNVDMEPDDALRVLLGEEKREDGNGDGDADADADAEQDE